MKPIITASFNDQPIEASAGMTVGAALVANGINNWRSTRFNGRRRGLFCGIGVCFDCLVDVDDNPNQRACLIQVQDGMKITGASADATLSDTDDEEDPDEARTRL